MKLSQFDYKTPTSKKEVVDLLINLGQDSAILAGGTDLIPHMKNGTLMPKTLVSLNHLSASQRSFWHYYLRRETQPAPAILMRRQDRNPHHFF
jgi:hypothetical protein